MNRKYVVMKLINGSVEFLAGVAKDGGIAVHFTHDAEDAPHFDTEEQAEAFLASAIATLGASNFKMTGVFIGRAVPIPYEEKLALLRQRYDNLVELRVSREECGTVTDDHIHVCDEAFEALAQHIRKGP